MLSVVLPIFFHTEESKQLEDADIDYDLAECDQHPMRFYSIAAINAKRGYPQYSVIHANGAAYSCALSEDEVDKMITGVRVINN